MRSESEMLALILDFARQRDDVRVVALNGSRANPNAAKDHFQDYDIVYYVRRVAPYRRNPHIPPLFGEVMILQTPDDMGSPPPAVRASYAYLMQFMDGNRIDVTFSPLSALKRARQDSLTVALLDKDNRLADLPPASDRGYWPQPPTEKQFDDCCNEFWWLNPYVAKGLWRGELTYAHAIYDTLLRNELMQVLTWFFGLQTGFVSAAGKMGKNLRAGLPPGLWAMLEATYCDACPEHTWQALLTMGALFRQTAQPVAQAFRYRYPQTEDDRVSAYLRRIRDLPAGAESL